MKNLLNKIKYHHKDGYLNNNNHEKFVKYKKDNFELVSLNYYFKK